MSRQSIPIYGSTRTYEPSRLSLYSRRILPSTTLRLLLKTIFEIFGHRSRRSLLREHLQCLALSVATATFNLSSTAMSNSTSTLSFTAPGTRHTHISWRLHDSGYGSCISRHGRHRYHRLPPLKRSTPIYLTRQDSTSPAHAERNTACRLWCHLATAHSIPRT